MNTAAAEGIGPAGGQGARELRRIAWMVLWTAFFTGLGLAHIRLQIAIRDLDMQRSRYMEQATDLLARESELQSEVSQLRCGGRRLDSARERLGLQPVAPEKVQVWEMSAEMKRRFEKVCLEIDMARGRESEGDRARDPWLVRILATILPLGSAPDAADSAASGTR